MKLAHSGVEKSSSKPDLWACSFPSASENGSLANKSRLPTKRRYWTGRERFWLPFLVRSGLCMGRVVAVPKFIGRL